MPADRQEPAAARNRGDDRTVSLTYGPWGGVGVLGNRTCWRINLGWLALTYFKGEFTELLRAWLDSLDAKEARSV